MNTFLKMSQLSFLCQNLVDLVGDVPDVEVRCGDLMVKVHKAVLTAHSLTFQTAFSNTHLGKRYGGEGSQGSTHCSLPHLPDCL